MTDDLSIDFDELGSREYMIGRLAGDMFAHIAFSGPMVCLKDEDSEIDVFVGEILAGGRTETRWGMWGDIWSNIDWNAPRDNGRGDRYSVKSLQLIGYLGEACRISHGAVIPSSTLLLAMAALQPDPPLLEVYYASGQTFIRTTEEGEAVLSIEGSVRVGRSIVKFDNPQQLFSLGPDGDPAFIEANKVRRPAPILVERKPRGSKRR